MTGGVSRLATAAGPLGEQKRKGETPMRGCCTSVVGGRVRAAWEISQESLRSCRGRHKPFLIITLTPEVAPRELPPCVSTFARPRGWARGGAGRMSGAAAAPLDHVSGPSARNIYRRNYTNPP